MSSPFSWKLPSVNEPHFIPLLAYCAIACLIFLGDGLMSYVTPLFIESTVSNPLIMGIVMSFSSIVGITCDTLFPRFFQSKHHLFFLWATVLISLFFPLSFLLLPHAVMTFLLGVAIWGIYFEFLFFSNSAFIRANIMFQNNALAWGIILSARAIAQFLSPLIAAPLYDISENLPVVFALGFFIAALFGVIILQQIFPSKFHGSQQKVVEKSYSFLQQFGVWKSLMKRFWALHALMFSHFIMEASIWTIGILLAEELQQKLQIGKFFVAFYLAPFLYMGLVGTPLGRKYGKKRVSILSSLLGGIVLAVAGAQPQVWIFLTGTVFAAHCFAMALPLLLATYEDFSARAGKRSQDIIGIQASSSSLGWIFGPILAGGLATVVGYQLSFSILGLIMAIFALIALVLVPKKIRLPQAELNELTG